MMKILILNKKTSLPSEQFEEIYRNFQERCDLILKATKKQGFTLSVENANLEKLQLLSKFEVKEHFLKFPNFRFWLQSNIENSETLEVFFFSS